MEGLLYYKEKTDIWTLKTDEKDLCVNTLIYGLSDLGFEFDGEGEIFFRCNRKININVPIKINLGGKYMDTGYAVKSKLDGKAFVSEIYFDAQEASEKYDELNADKRFSDVKLFNAFIHYEEIKEDK
jgi:hypothetical protein